MAEESIKLELINKPNFSDLIRIKDLIGISNYVIELPFSSGGEICYAFADVFSHDKLVYLLADKYRNVVFTKQDAIKVHNRIKEGGIDDFSIHKIRLDTYIKNLQNVCISDAHGYEVDGDYKLLDTYFKRVSYS